MARTRICKIDFEKTMPIANSFGDIENTCELNRQECIKAIKDAEYVYFRSSTLDAYSKKPTEIAIMLIGKSYFGAEVEKDDATDEMYVNVPFFT